jgi:hypothetical protein
MSGPSQLYRTSSVNQGNSSGGGSVRVKQRSTASSDSVKLKGRRNQSLASTVFGGGNSCGRVLKFIIVGDDEMLSNTAKAFTFLRCAEPNLFWNLEIQFNYIPLSQGSSGYATLNGASSGLLCELPEPANELKCKQLAGDVLIGRFLAHMDSWYEQNIMLAVHNTLRLIPNDSSLSHKQPSNVENLDIRWNAPPTPSKILIDIVTHYIREATNPIRVKMFKVKMTLRSEKKGFDNREVYMFHQLDIQKLTQKKNRQAKPYEASIALTELSMDNIFIKGELTQLKDVWIIRGSNIPHPTDSSVPNPENECLELTILKCQQESARSKTKYRITEETQHHVYDLLVEAKDKNPISVIIDDDVANITENVIRVEVTPAYFDQGIVEPSLTRRNDRQDRQMHFPIMSFWQIDL